MSKAKAKAENKQEELTILGCGNLLYLSTTTIQRLVDDAAFFVEMDDLSAPEYLSFKNILKSSKKTLSNFLELLDAYEKGF